MDPSMKSGILYAYSKKYCSFMPIIIFFRDLGDGFFEMACTLHIDKEILQHPIPYKYVIESPKTRRDGNCYEYLHAHASRWREYNRCLSISAIEGRYPIGNMICFILFMCVEL